MGRRIHLLWIECPVNNLIMADRKKLKNPNGLILGTPGAGKSFAAKREITNAFIVTKMTLSCAIRRESIIRYSGISWTGYPHFTNQS